MKKKYYFTQISAIFIAVLSSYIAFELLDNWFQPGNIVHEGAFPFSRSCRWHWIVRVCHLLQAVPTPCFIK
ncbi:hypothetical protein [Desulfonema ishimotonii]|uniref:hypothetical protein n=1 Tax=Desulfonema ishimotonii TaxID=45657 RepID=UPI000F572050|nr:hypothetical protein [Desulfonema ishimotonii]